VTQALSYNDEKCLTAIMALEALDPQDAATIAVAVLDEVSAGYPIHTAFGDIQADAAFWADCANVAELEAYFAASLKRLGNQALGIHSRKRLFVLLWNGFALPDRRAFLGRVDADGRFIREVAA
jgi:hypothetical protein